MTKMNREEILSVELKELNEKCSVIRKELEQIRFDKRIEEYNSYIGKYFKKIDKYKDNCVIYCSSVDKERRRIVALCVSYYGESNDYYSIQQENDFDPLSEYNDNDVWEEIDKSEFYKHYNHVQSVINKKLGNI